MIYNTLIVLLLTSCSHLFYHPDNKVYSDPNQVGYKADNLKIQSQGILLDAYFIHHQTKSKAKGLIIQFHGNAQNISSHFASVAWLAKEGYDVISFDYRGYGKSQGSPNQEGLYQDALAVLNYAIELKQKKEYPQLIVIGQSLGGVVLSRAIVDVEQKNFNLLVLDSTFSSYEDVGEKKIYESWIGYVLGWMTPLLVSDEYASAPVLKKISIPTLVVHSKDDPIVPYSCGKDIYDAIIADKFFLELEGPTHTGVFYAYGIKMREEFVNLLNAKSGLIELSIRK